MSPELLDPEHFGLNDSQPTKESDCYALGMVVYEVLSGQVPFAPFKDFVVMRKVIEGQHPARPEGRKGVWFTDGLWGMTSLCWATQPARRPSIEAVLECLDQVSNIWEPLPSQADEDEVGAGEDVVEADEDDWYLATVNNSSSVVPCLDPNPC